jgi:hypothetical protein
MRRLSTSRRSVAIDRAEPSRMPTKPLHVAGWACSIASRGMELRVFGKSRPATYKNDRRPQPNVAAIIYTLRSLSRHGSGDHASPRSISIALASAKSLQ